MDFPGRLIAGLMAIILIAIFPLQYIAQTQQENLDSIITSETKEFTDSIREKGYLDKKSYEKYMSFLEDTGELYDVELEDIHPVTGEDIELSKCTDVGCSDFHEEHNKTIVLTAEDRIKNDGTSLFKENENDGKIIQAKINSKEKPDLFKLSSESDGLIKSFATHTHTSDCYNGTLHVCNGTNCTYANPAVVVAASSDGLYYSYDGITWTRSLFIGGAGISEVTYGNGRFVAVQGGYSYTSTDGINWTSKWTSGIQLYTITYGNGVFAANAWVNGYGSMMYSTDGLNWSSVGGPGSTVKFDDVGYTYGYFFLMKGDSNFPLEYISNSFGTISYLNQPYFSAGDTTYYLSSANNWLFYTKRTYYGTYDLYMHTHNYSTSVLSVPSPRTIVCYGNGIYMAASYNKIYKSTSANYGTWQLVTDGTVGNIASLTCFGDRFIVSCTNNYGQPRTYYSTNNGSSWTESSNAPSVAYSLACNVDGGSGVPDRGPCLKEGKHYDASGNEVQPTCSSVVTGVTATSPTQTIDKGGSIESTATATYLDGHTGIVACSVSGFDTNTVGVQNVTLTYTGTVGNARTWGTRSCTSTVTVRASTKQCTAGLGHADYAGTLSACPVCTAITKVSANSQTFNYDGTHHKLTISNTSGYSVHAAYDTDPTDAGIVWQWDTGPVQPGTYPVHIYVVVNDVNNNPQWYFVMQRFITIKDYVWSMTATLPNQTVYYGQNIVTTATITKATGGTEVVNCTVQGYSSTTIGTQTVYLIYSGLTNMYGVNPSCITTVTVKPNIASITVTPQNQSIERYSNPVFTVTAAYQDGTIKNLTNYTMSGLDNKSLSSQAVTISYSENGNTVTATATVNVTNLTKVCPVCGTRYPLDNNDIDQGCPICQGTIKGITVTPNQVEVSNGAALPITVKAVYNNGTSKEVTGWTSNYNSSRSGFQTVTVEYGGFGAVINVWVREEKVICPICGTEYPVSAGKCPVCSDKVAYLEVKPNIVTVRQNDVLNLDVIAHYADGSSASVDDWSIDKTTAEAGTFTATVIYKGVMATITLTVIPLSAVTCPLCGLVYEPADNPKGCPVCAYTITGIEAYLTSGSNLVQYGTTPTVAVVIIFLDGHREITTEGYTIDDFNSSILGIQTVTIFYQSFYTTLELEVVNTLSTITCPNGHVYYLNEDGSDPGCPFCAITDDFEKVYYFEITYITEILDTVYKDGVYHFKKGNYITFRVEKKDVSLLTKIQKTFFKTALLGRKKRFINGGEID